MSHLLLISGSQCHISLGRWISSYGLALFVVLEQTYTISSQELVLSIVRSGQKLLIVFNCWRSAPSRYSVSMIGRIYAALGPAHTFIYRPLLLPDLFKDRTRTIQVWYASLFAFEQTKWLHIICGWCCLDILRVTKEDFPARTQASASCKAVSAVKQE